MVQEKQISSSFRTTCSQLIHLDILTATRTEAKYATPMTETFKYDALDRLDTVSFNNAVSDHPKRKYKYSNPLRKLCPTRN